MCGFWSIYTLYVLNFLDYIMFKIERWSSGNTILYQHTLQLYLLVIEWRQKWCYCHRLLSVKTHGLLGIINIYICCLESRLLRCWCFPCKIILSSETLQQYDFERDHSICSNQIFCLFEFHLQGITGEKLFGVNHEITWLELYADSDTSEVVIWTM